MAEQILKYKHQLSCSGNKPKQPKTKVITMQQNQVLEIPSDDIEIEAQENQEVSPVMVDTTANQELHLENVEGEQIKSGASYNC